MFSLGPKGSVWAMGYSYCAAPDAGTVAFDLASVPEPDPDRGGVDDEGTLLKADDVTYVPLTGNLAHYGAVFADVEHNGTFPFRLMGDDLAPLTAIGPASDPFTGYDEADGGAGMYRLRMRVTTKAAASTGYVVRLTSLTMSRLDDFGFR